MPATATMIEQPTGGQQHDKIKASVLALLGRPPMLRKVQVTYINGIHYRINVWVADHTKTDIMSVMATRIAHSYYVTIGADDEVIDSSPALTRQYADRN